MRRRTCARDLADDYLIQNNTARRGAAVSREVCVSAARDLKVLKDGGVTGLGLWPWAYPFGR
jgi:hypothetical protein